MRLSANPTIANVSPDLLRLVGKISIQLNGITEGTASAFHTAATAAPTTGTWAAGDAVKNSAPAEAGVVGSKYVVTHWVCTVAGTPGTWLACRSLTGN